MAWVRIDNTRKLRNVGGDLHLARRVYGRNGELWPRIAVAVYGDKFDDDGNPCQPPKRFKVTCSTKTKPGAWWEDDYYGIPFELADDVCAMIKEVQEGDRG